MDASKAVDLLFGGVVPERMDQVRAEWGDAEDRVLLNDIPEFVLQVTQDNKTEVSEKALRHIWLAGYAAWAAIEAYNVRIVWERLNGSRFDPATWHSYAQQKPLDDAFDRLVDKFFELSVAPTLDGFDWPAEVPVPAEDMRIEDGAKKATFDLVCMAGAFVFAHELRHVLLQKANQCPPRLIDEERACDGWAIALMLDGVPGYAAKSQHPEASVRAKRLLGIMVAQCVILTLTYPDAWHGGGSHPSVRERIVTVLDAAVDPVPEWFWTSIASILAAFARKLDALPAPMPFPASDRELAYALCDRFA